MSNSTTQELADTVRLAAQQRGFALCGIAPASRPDTLDFLHQWLESGMHGEMAYLQKRREAYSHPENVLPEVVSVIVCAMNYGSDTVSDDRIGKTARYAADNHDYHDVLRGQLKGLAGVMHDVRSDCRTRVVVDTAPLLERDFARLAGLGWFGKNTMLINKHLGSYFFLGAILTNLELAPDQPHATSHCGTCTRCLEACPTDAFPQPHRLDARRCISYLTIELRDKPIPVELRAGIGDWLFGCDVCQEVCPWNRKSPSIGDTSLIRNPGTDRTGPTGADSIEDARLFLTISEDEFRCRFRHTPYWRTGRVGMARNAAIVVGNLRSVPLLDDLILALGDNSPIVRGAVCWALGQFQIPQTREILRSQRDIEQEVDVLLEIDAALKECS